MSTEVRGPLAGLVVADFSRVLAGPLVTMTLADLGATVVKVERPDAGDETRSWGPPWWEGIATYYLALNRGGPVAWISEEDAERAGIEDNDWMEMFNLNGAVAVRAVVSQRVQPGMVMMYHAQEKIVNTPGSEIMGTRGGIHNSVTRACPKPTHMIGGYAQQSYGFNYYGTVGANRDEFVIVRKMAKVDWMDSQ